MNKTVSEGSDSRSAKSIFGEIGRWLPGVLISGAAIYAMFRLVSFKDLGSALGRINLLYLIPGIILVIIWLMLRALALKLILAGKPTLAQTFRAVNTGYLINNILPLRAGELAKAIMLGRSSGLGMTKVFSGIVIERAFDLFFAAGLLLTVLPLVLEMSWTKTAAIVVLILVTAGLITLFVMARKNDAIQSWISKAGQRWPLISRYVQPQIASFLSGFSILTNFRQFIICLLAIGSSWGVAVVLYFVMMFCIIPEPQFWWGVFVNSVLAMGIAIPSAPAALGVFEAAMVAALKVLGTPYSDALAYSVIMHFLQIAITAIFGVYALMKEKQSLEGLFNLSRKSRHKDETENPPTRCVE